LPTATHIYEYLRLLIDFVHRAQLRIESPEILPMRLISCLIGEELVFEMALRENRLRSSDDREPLCENSWSSR